MIVYINMKSPVRWYKATIVLEHVCVSMARVKLIINYPWVEMNGYGAAVKSNTDSQSQQSTAVHASSCSTSYNIRPTLILSYTTHKCAFKANWPLE